MANEEGVETGLFFANVEEFVHNFFAPMVGDSVGWGVGTAVRWCPEWWRHPAAISRLTALWRAFEHLREDPAFGMSTWWRRHGDYHLSMLTGPDGPFRFCSPQEGHSDLVGALPLTDPPAGLFGLRRH